MWNLYYENKRKKGEQKEWRLLDILITISTKAEIVRQFTDGAAATQLVTFGGHIPLASGGSGIKGQLRNGSLFPKIVGKS